MKKRKEKITCFCENVIEAEFPEKVDLVVDPHVEEEILNGTFMAVQCPHCGKILKLEYPVRIIDRNRGIDIFLIPEYERAPYLTGKVVYNVGKRVVIGFPELLDKITVLRNGLDDRVVEIIKYHFMQKAGPELDIKIYFQNIENDKLVFHIHGLKEDEIGITRVSLSFYRRISETLEKDVDSEPYREILTPPYISANKIYIGGPTN